MTANENLFSKPLSIEDLEARFKNVLANVFSFFTESCCIDTEPPIPGGGK
jgi:hypothetical protein